jgi:predicted RNA methylase
MEDLKKLNVFQLKEIIKEFKLNNNIKKPALTKMKKDDLIHFILMKKIKIPAILPKATGKYNPLSKYKVDANKPPEQEKYLKELNENPRYDNPLKALKPYYDSKTNKQVLTKLMPHQIAFIKAYIFNGLRGAVMFHGVGSGKTLTAVVTSYYYLKMFPDKRVLIISPSALLYNFIEGLIQYGLPIEDNRYSFWTYEKYIRSKNVGDNSLVIIDEAHNFRTYIGKNTATDQLGNEVINITSNKRGWHVKEYGTDRAHKVLLLTGTPFVNVLYDIENLLAMVDKREPIPQGEFYQMIGQPEVRHDYFRHRISHYERTQNDKNFPERREQIIPIYMNDDTLSKYEKIQNTKKDESDKDLQAIYNGVRNVSSSIYGENNPKIKWVYNRIMKNKNKKSIVYCSLYDAGIALLMNLLNKSGVKYVSITGRQNAKSKEDAKNLYNGYNFQHEITEEEIRENKYINNDYRVLIISKAGAEGVSTVNTQNIMLLDSQWNDSTSEQIIARAIRFKSHIALSDKDNYVNVFRIILVKPSDKPIVDKILSPAFKDYGFVLNGYKESRSDKNKLLRNQDKAPTFTEAKTSKQFDMKIYKALKTPHEKEAYRKSSLEFERRREKSSIEDTIKQLTQSTPAIDLYMLILSKSKEVEINKMVLDLDTKIKSFEDYYTDKIEHQLIEITLKNQAKAGRELTTKEKSLINLKLFERVKNKAVSVISKEDNSQAYNERMEKIKKLKDRQLSQEKIKRLQQYFTDTPMVKKMIELSGLSTNLNTVDILEPSAGIGSIVKEILQLKNVNCRFDLVEIDPENRIILKELENEAPDLVALMETPNFLDFFTSKKYDMILMNPPFHLKKSLNLVYNRDIYDMDFIRRAFAFVKVGGSLTAIISQKWKQVNEYKKWLETHNFVFKDYNNYRWGGIQKGNLSAIQSLNLTIIKLNKSNYDEDSDLLKLTTLKNIDKINEVASDVKAFIKFPTKK